MRTPGHSPRVRGAALLAAALAGAGLALGCASAHPRPDDGRARALAAADADVRAGCYDCLLRARDAYARYAPGRDSAAVLVRLFETELLLAVREKELALDWEATLRRARALAPRVPATLDAARLLEIVDAVLPDPNGLPSRRFAALRRAREPFRRRVAGELAWLDSTPLAPAVRDYLAIALECSPIGPGVASTGKGPPPTPARARARAADAPPLLAYRAGICPPTDVGLVRRADSTVPAFDEAAYFLAQRVGAAAAETGGDEARALFARAHARFPRAAGVAYLFAWMESVVGDCEAALRHADAALAAEPAHDGALLQRTICLSGLGRDSASVEAATRLIAVEPPSSPQGHYWRALGRHRLKALAEARADIDAAKRRSMADNVLTLAGVIEHDQDDLAIAEQDLRSALASWRGPTNCTASSYLARVLMKGTRLRESAESFEAAMACYDLKVAGIRERIELLRATTHGNPEFRVRRIARLEADSAEQRSAYFAAAFNGASVSARGGDVARATRLLEIASRDSSRAELVGKLREALRLVGRR